MSIIYTTAVKNARMTAVRDQIDAGAGPGVLQIGTTGMATILAEIALDDPSATISAGTLTFSGMPKSDSIADATGTATAARIQDSNGTDIITGLTVGLAAADIIMSGVLIIAGQTVTINSASITHA